MGRYDAACLLLGDLEVKWFIYKHPNFPQPHKSATLLCGDHVKHLCLSESIKCLLEVWNCTRTICYARMKNVLVSLASRKTIQFNRRKMPIRSCAIQNGTVKRNRKPSVPLIAVVIVMPPADRGSDNTHTHSLVYKAAAEILEPKWQKSRRWRRNGGTERGRAVAASASVRASGIWCCSTPPRRNRSL